MARQEDGQSFGIATSRGEAVLSQTGESWRVRGSGFEAVTPRGGTIREVLKAAFGVAEGTVLSGRFEASSQEGEALERS